MHVHFLKARRTCALGPAVLNKLWAPMAADHSARGSMKTGVKPETVCELQDTNDHRQVERKWRLPISVGKLSALEGRLINLCLYHSRGCSSCERFSRGELKIARAKWRHLKCQWNIWRADRSNARDVKCPDTELGVCVCEAFFGALYIISHSTSGVLDHALNLSISLSAGKETKWDSPSNGE